MEQAYLVPLLLIRGFPKFGVPFCGSPSYGLSYFGVCSGVALFGETTIYTPLKTKGGYYLLYMRDYGHPEEKANPKP